MPTSASAAAEELTPDRRRLLLLAIAPLAAVPVVLGFVPETRGRRLEEIAEA